MIINNLPCPRFEFRWEPTEIEFYNWICRYSLVIPLGEYDCRRGDDDERSEIALEIGSTRCGLNGDRTPVDPDGSVTTPFRDGAHAQWDNKSLGGHIPIVAICGDVVSVVPYNPPKDIE